MWTTPSASTPIHPRVAQPGRAAHVQAAIAAALQPKSPVSSRWAAPRARAAHVEAAVSRAAQPRMAGSTGVRPRLPATATPQSVPAAPFRPAGRVQGLRAVVLQPYTVHGNYKVSTSTDYATNGRHLLYLRNGVVVATPGIYTWTWQASGGLVTINGIQYRGYQARQNNGTGVALPSDCIKTAQIVAAGARAHGGANLADLDGLPEPDYRAGGPTSGALAARPAVGEVYLVVHSRTAGDFHAASVILHDGNDNLTLEADVDDPLTFRQSNLLFDMYDETTAGHSFWANQGNTATDRVWRFGLGAAAGGAGAGTLAGDIQDRLDARQLTRLGHVMT